MAGPSYPLEALRKLRDERAEAQAHGLAAQVLRSQAAERTLNERTAARQAHAARTAESLDYEHERLVSGEASGQDLLRVAEFEQAARAQAALLERAEADARQALSRERVEEHRLREQLAAREAEAQLVRKHESKFHEQRAEVQQKAEEEAALEQWSARRH